MLSIIGCGRKQAVNEVASVNGRTISQEQFQSLLDMRGHGDTNRFASVESRAALLDELIRRDAILAKAKAAGFDQRPDIQESIERLIVSKYQDEHFKHVDEEEAVSDAEIQQYYQQHADKYAEPAKARGAILYLKISPQAAPEKRHELMARAQTILAEARADTTQDFVRLVQVNSEDQATRYRGGDIGWINREAGAAGLENPVVDALFALQKPGDFAPLVSVHGGVYIVKLVDGHPAGPRPLDEVKNAIAYTVRKQKQAQREQDFYASMESGLDIRINHPLLETMHQSPSPAPIPPAIPGAMAQK